jgi:predicted nucleic acid-binding protein
MQLVLDANILFKALIGKGRVSRILFSDKVNLLAPEFLFEEFEKHKPEIAEKGRISLSELGEALSLIKEEIQIIPSEEISSSIKLKARTLSPHSKDEAYFAVALAFNIIIWSDELRFKKQLEVKVFNTSELIELLNLRI